MLFFKYVSKASFVNDLFRLEAIPKKNQIGMNMMYAMNSNSHICVDRFEEACALFYWISVSIDRTRSLLAGYQRFVVPLFFRLLFCVTLCRFLALYINYTLGPQQQLYASRG